MGEPPSKKPWFQFLKAVRVIIVIPVLVYVILVALAVYAAITAVRSKCPKAVVASVISLAVVTSIRLIWLIINGCIQAATASVMNAVKPAPVSDEEKNGSMSNVRDRRRWFRKWRWWNRLGTLVLISQLVAAYVVVRNNDEIQHGSMEKRLQTLLVILPVVSLAVVVLGWFMGSEVMSWRSLYTSNDAWKAHYSEAFRSYIRQALCCTGRYRYLGKEQDGEVFSVASLLGELVSYRAEGCSHLEALAGVSLLHGNKQRSDVSEKQEPVPEHVLCEASILHQYAVAAYTGPLLELGRYPYCWPFAWLYSQGFWSFWKRSRRPVLKGDNLWRGHAAAFVRHARLAPEDILCEGRVLQTDRESAYFVVISKKLRTVVVAVRGTETLEDLLTDGLSREACLRDSDLLGLLRGPHVSSKVKQHMKGNKHYAHRGIIEAARKLSKELDNLAEDDNDAMFASDLASIEGHKGNESLTGSGLLTKLLGPNGTHKNYDLRLVGHSLGGSICALTGLRLYRWYPKLRVYAFGNLPCVDEVVAEACQHFITSVVCHDEFASRLSVASIMRLRAKALQALSEDTKLERAKRICSDLEGQQGLPISSSDRSSTSLSRLARIFSSDSHTTIDTGSRKTQSPSPSRMKKWSELRKTQRLPFMFKGGVFLCAHTCFCIFRMSQHHKATGLSSEVERYVELMTRLDPPVPNGMTERKGNMGSNLSGIDEGQFMVVNMEMQPHDTGCREAPCDESRPKESDIPMRMGSGFVNISGHETGAKLQELNPLEMYLPGRVIHLLKEEIPAGSWKSSFWNSWQAERMSKYRAALVDRKTFQDLVISPSMFIDHMPWKCQHALNCIVSQLNPLNIPEPDSSGAFVTSRTIICVQE